MTDDLDTGTLRFSDLCFEAARAGGTTELAGLLDAGLSPNLANASRDTLLILAAKNVHPDTVRLLLDRGADVSRVNEHGQTALNAAVSRQSAEIVQVLLEAGADPALGEPSAYEVATFFRLPAMAALLRGERMP
jgi:ankyrin repeat protein